MSNGVRPRHSQGPEQKDRMTKKPPPYYSDEELTDRRNKKVSHSNTTVKPRDYTAQHSGSTPRQDEKNHRSPDVSPERKHMSLSEVESGLLYNLVLLAKFWGNEEDTAYWEQGEVGLLYRKLKALTFTSDTRVWALKDLLHSAEQVGRQGGTGGSEIGHRHGECICWKVWSFLVAVCLWIWGGLSHALSPPEQRPGVVIDHHGAEGLWIHNAGEKKGGVFKPEKHTRIMVDNNATRR